MKVLTVSLRRSSNTLGTLKSRVGRDEQGFTLIELLVVILIIGILAAIALPTYLDQQKKAHDAAAKHAARVALTAMMSCFADKGTYLGCDAAELRSIEPSLNSVELEAPSLGWGSRPQVADSFRSRSTPRARPTPST